SQSLVGGDELLQRRRGVAAALELTLRARDERRDLPGVEVVTARRADRSLRSPEQAGDTAIARDLSVQLGLLRIPLCGLRLRPRGAGLRLPQLRQADELVRRGRRREPGRPGGRFGAGTRRDERSKLRRELGPPGDGDLGLGARRGPPGEARLTAGGDSRDTGPACHQCEDQTGGGRDRNNAHLSGHGTGGSGWWLRAAADRK